MSSSSSSSSWGPTASTAEERHIISEIFPGMFCTDEDGIQDVEKVTQLRPYLILSVGEAHKKFDYTEHQKLFDANGIKGLQQNVPYIVDLELGEDMNLLNEEGTLPTTETYAELSQEDKIVRESRLLQRLDEAVLEIMNQIGDCPACHDEDAKCIVWCTSGALKSIVVVIAFMMKYRDNTFQQAYDASKMVRPCVALTPYFAGLLGVYEKSLYRNLLKANYQPSIDSGKLREVMEASPNKEILQELWALHTAKGC